MGKTTDLFKKIRDPKGKCYVKMGTDEEQKWQGPNRSRRDLREGGKNTQKNYIKKSLMTQITTMVWLLT